MNDSFKKIAASAGFLLLLSGLGCGSNPGQSASAPSSPTQASPASDAAVPPSITQVTPQTIPAGSQAATLKVTGSNFAPQASILWNGAMIATTVVDANTLSGAIGGASLATPGAVQLQVQNTQTMQESAPVPVTIAAAASPGAASAPSATLTISTSALPQGRVDAAYTFGMSAAGGTAPYRWSITAGQLPPGVVLAGDTGAFSGTPSSSGNYAVSITAVDSSSPAQTATVHSLALAISAEAADPSAPLSVATSSLPEGEVGSAYTSSLSAAGGTAPYNWTISAGQLPGGLNLAPNTGIISGTPNASGTFTISLTATDSGSPVQSATRQDVSLTVAPPAINDPAPRLAISTAALPQGGVSSGYEAQLHADGGTPPYTWSVTSGQLPPGLSLAGDTGTLSGTPASSGTYSIGITAMDASSPAQFATVKLSLWIAGAPATPAPLVINSTSVAAATAGANYSARLQASGGVTPYTWSIRSGGLPAGLKLDASSGLISGTPSANGTASFTVSVSDSASPSQTQSAGLSVSVASPPLAITSPSSLPSGKVESAYSAGLQAAGGRAPYTWAIAAGTLPAGVSLAADTGVISGTPTSSGNFSVGVKAIDSSSPAQTATLPVDLSVQGSANTLTNLQSDTWDQSGQVAPNYTDCNQSCPGVSFSMSKGVSSPSLSGNASKWNLGGSNAYSDVLFFDHLIGAFSTHNLPDSNHTLIPSLHNFVYDLYFYAGDPTHIQAMEFDINMSLNSVGMTWSTECRIAGGNQWDIWDNANWHWVPSGFACHPLANAWNHVTVTGQRGANNTVIYQTITLNGVTNVINRTFAPYVVPSNWYGVTVNYQMDGDRNQTSESTYSDNMSLTYW